MTRVAILATDHGALFELGCAVELFGLSRPEYENWYRAEVVSFEAADLGYTAGVRLGARKIRSLQSFDMVVIPSWDTDSPPDNTRLVNQLRLFHAQGKRLLSFCSGAFLLGYLGILDGREATTHWRYREKFQALFPNAHYADDVLYVYDGQVGCSAGSAAGLDLGIEIIREDFGYRVANQVARRLVLSAHRSGGQSQFVETPVHQAPGKFAQALDWAIRNLPSISTVAVVAEQAHMSRRSFDRKFRSSFGIAPNEWLIEQRLVLAKTLLEDSTASMETVAEAAGFGSAITMRYHFNRKYGITPSHHRQQFRASS